MSFNEWITFNSNKDVLPDEQIVALAIKSNDKNIVVKTVKVYLESFTTEINQTPEEKYDYLFIDMSNNESININLNDIVAYITLDEQYILKHVIPSPNESGKYLLAINSKIPNFFDGLLVQHDKILNKTNFLVKINEAPLRKDILGYVAIPDYSK